MPERSEAELIRQYREKAEFIADSLRFRRVAPAEEIEAYLPGGAKNPKNDLDAVIFGYASMVRICDRIEEESKIDSSVLDEALLDSPEVVSLSGDKTISVYPKSFAALRFVESCDRRIEWLAQQRATLLGMADTAGDLELLTRVSAEIQFSYELIAWIATFNQPGLPFDEESVPIGVPEELRELSTVDFATIRNAFLRVNALRLALLVKMLSTQSGTDANGRDSWATFFAHQESEGHGPARHLMRDRSLVSQLAAALTVGESRRRAEEKAKEKEGPGAA